MPVPPTLMTFYRRNLPHWIPEGKAIFITWRLHGTLPAAVQRKIRAARNACPSGRRGFAAENHRAGLEDSFDKAFLLMDGHLDAARKGPMWLADREFADYAEYPILRSAELGRYDLHAYVVMPNHVHLLLTPHTPLSKISRTLKGVSARDINARLGRSGKPLWQDESFDHWIRNPEEFERIRRYIEWNPVNAGLVSHPELWQWSSADAPLSHWKRALIASGTGPVH